MFAARSTRRSNRWLVGTVATVLLFLLAPVAPARAADDGVPVPPRTGMTNKGTGSVSAADRDFVVKVRLAGLWEVPAGNMAQEKSEDPRVVAIGKAISQQHVALDKLAMDAAKKLGLALPNKPTQQQEGWLAEMQAANATTFDQVYVDRLRAAHGAIFPAIATIRASTRNDAVRKLAQDTNQFVMTHLTLLESSGLVNYGSLPTAPPPKADSGPVPVDGQMIAAATGSGGVPGMNTSVILLVLAVALVAGVISTMRIVRAR
jgi:predicted outer membrane protein